MSSIFSKIVSGEIPAYKVAETKNFLAFLDVFPIVKGHTLVIPKSEIDNIFDLENELFSGLHLFSKEVAHALEKAVSCKRIATAIVGLEVPHAHIHLLPINSAEEVNFYRPKLKFSPDEMTEFAKSINSAWKGLAGPGQSAH
jgi:histidine triad (HIT) family protein